MCVLKHHFNVSFSRFVIYMYYWSAFLRIALFKFLLWIIFSLVSVSLLCVYIFVFVPLMFDQRCISHPAEGRD